MELGAPHPGGRRELDGADLLVGSLHGSTWPDARVLLAAGRVCAWTREHAPHLIDATHRPANELECLDSLLSITGTSVVNMPYTSAEVLDRLSDWLGDAVRPGRGPAAAEWVRSSWIRPPSRCNCAVCRCLSRSRSSNCSGASCCTPTEWSPTRRSAPRSGATPIPGQPTTPSPFTSADYATASNTSHGSVRIRGQGYALTVG